MGEALGLLIYLSGGLKSDRTVALQVRVRACRGGLIEPSTDGHHACVLSMHAAVRIDQVLYQSRVCTSPWVHARSAGDIQR